MWSQNSHGDPIERPQTCSSSSNWAQKPNFSFILPSPCQILTNNVRENKQSQQDLVGSASDWPLWSILAPSTASMWTRSQTHHQIKINVNVCWILQRGETCSSAIKSRDCFFFMWEPSCLHSACSAVGSIALVRRLGRPQTWRKDLQNALPDESFLVSIDIEICPKWDTFDMSSEKEMNEKSLENVKFAWFVISTDKTCYYLLSWKWSQFIIIVCGSSIDITSIESMLRGLASFFFISDPRR